MNIWFHDVVGVEYLNAYRHLVWCSGILCPYKSGRHMQQTGYYNCADCKLSDYGTDNVLTCHIGG